VWVLIGAEALEEPEDEDAGRFAVASDPLTTPECVVAAAEDAAFRLNAPGL